MANPNNKSARGGLLSVKVNGEVMDAKGNWTVGLGGRKRTGIKGADRPHGFAETDEIPYIEGAITDRQDLDLRKLFDTTGATVIVQFASGKSYALRESWCASDRTVSTEEGEVPIRFEGLSLEEI